MPVALNTAETEARMVSQADSSTLSHQGAGMGARMSWMLDPSLTWNDIAWLAEEVRIPVLVQGICRADDARLAMPYGELELAMALAGCPRLSDLTPDLIKPS